MNGYIPPRLKNNSGRDTQQKQEKIAVTAPEHKQFVVFGHRLAPLLTHSSICMLLVA